jgi:hypothetical protein
VCLRRKVLAVDARALSVTASKRALPH